MVLEILDTNAVVYNKGDKGDCFYYILLGTIRVYKRSFQKTEEEKKMIVFDEEDTKPFNLNMGQTFGELSLIYGIERNTTNIALCNSILIKLEKIYFDKYIPNFFEKQLNEMLKFLKLCPIFHNFPKEILLKIAIRTEEKKYFTGSVICRATYKTEEINLIRLGNVKVNIYK
jgi:CRP-like cAMP-binding protein